MNEDIRFLYCHDPLDDDSGEYILHLGNPSALIKIIPLEEEDAVDTDEFIHKIYLYEDEEGDEEEYQLIFTGFSASGEADTDLIISILDEAWEYWAAILDMPDDDL